MPHCSLPCFKSMGSTRTHSFEFMDWDLWGPPCYEVDEESEKNVVVGWQHRLAGDGIDTIEENMLNEISCLQVLRILITEADAEIHKLDEYIVSLQNELAWDEYEEWSEICCDTLKHKIDCLNVSLRSLKSRIEDDVDVASIIHEEPAEKLHVIVKKLLRNYYPKNYEKKFLQNEQLPGGSPVKESNSDILGCQKDENAVCCTPQEECTGENSSSKLPYEKSSYFEELCYQNEDYSISNAPVDEHDQNGGIAAVCKPKIEVGGEAEDMHHNLTNKERSIIIYSPLNFEFIWNSSRQIEPTDATIRKTDTDALRCSTGPSESEKRSKPCLATFLHGRPGSPDEEMMSSNSMQEISSGSSMKMTEISLTDAVVDSLSLWLRTEVKRESVDESFALDSTMEFPGQRCKDVMELQMVKEESEPPGFEKPDCIAVNCKSTLKVPLMPQNHGNSEEQPNPVNDQSSSALQIAAKALGPTESSRQRKSTNAKNSGCESKSKSSILPFHDESSLSLVATNISASSTLQPQKKTKISNFLVPFEPKDEPIEMDFSVSHGKATGCSDKKDSFMTGSNGRNDSSLMEIKSKASLQGMKLVDLRAIARRQKLKGYYKLPKKVLVELITNMGGC